MLVTFKEAATAPHHRGVLYRPLLSLCKMSRRNWYISHSSLYLCAMFQVLWSGFTLTFTSALFSLASFLGLTENSSIGFQWGVFHLRQSSLPFSYPQPLWQRLFILRSNFSACCLIWDLLRMLCPPTSGKKKKNHPVPQQRWRRCAHVTVSGWSFLLNVGFFLQNKPLL